MAEGVAPLERCGERLAELMGLGVELAASREHPVEMQRNGRGPAGAIMDRLVVTSGGDESAAAASHDGDGDGDGDEDGDGPVRPVRREMNEAEMRRHLTEVGDLRAIAKALAVKDEHEAFDILRQYSSGELSREVQILLESLFE